MMSLQVYVDIDDVLAETTRAANRLARESFGTKTLFEDMKVFDLRISLGLSQAQYEAFMKTLHSPDFLLGLAPFPDALTTLANWRAGGARIDLVTGRSPGSRAATLRWLADHSIEHHSLEFIDKYDRYADRETLPLSALKGRPYDFAIEDSASTADFLSQNTHSRVLLMDQPWNQELKPQGHSIERVHNWREVSARVGLSRTNIHGARR